MTQQTAKAFVDRFSTDEAFRDRLTAAGTPEDRRQIAREAGYDLSSDDLPAIKKALGVEELSDEDMEKIAGGMGGKIGGAIPGGGRVADRAAAGGIL